MSISNYLKHFRNAYKFINLKALETTRNKNK